MHVAEISTAPPTDLYRASTDSELLVHALSYDLDRPVLQFHDTGRIVSAGEFRDIVSTYVQAFRSLGLEKGTRVGILSRNRPEVVFVQGAAPFIDVCMIPMHPMGSIDDLTYVINDSSITALIFDPAYFRDHARVFQERAAHLTHLLALGPTEIGQDLTRMAMRFIPTALPCISGEPDDIVRMGYSGGTTGKPKAIMASRRNMAAMLNIMMMEWEWPSQIRQLVCTPLSHGGGTVLLPTLIKQGSLIVLPGFDPATVLAAIEKYRITCMLVVPAMIYALTDQAKKHRYDLSSLEVVYYGASAISPTRLKEAIEIFGSVFFQFYGQSEAPMHVSIMKRAEHDLSDMNRLASCGRPVPWVRVALMDDACKPVPNGTPGEICVQGPLVMSGYLNKPELTAEVFAGGWLHTGDVAIRDDDGFLRIVDRKKDMIVTGGFNVFPREVEDVLSSHTAVAAAAVIGVAHEKWGEAVHAVVVRRQGTEVSEAELIALVREKKGNVQAPKSVVFVDKIPLTGLGKPDKKALRTQYGQASTNTQGVSPLVA